MAKKKNKKSVTIIKVPFSGRELFLGIYGAFVLGVTFNVVSALFLQAAAVPLTLQLVMMVIATTVVVAGMLLLFLSPLFDYETKHNTSSCYGIAIGILMLLILMKIFLVS